MKVRVSFPICALILFAGLFPVQIVNSFFGGNSPGRANNPPGQTVNPIIGDISFVNKYGHQPNETTDNELRIKTHLEFVENLLRKKDVSELPIDLQNKRNHLLDLLHNYWTEGIFPRNYDFVNQRKPCFIDIDGNICAVGHLIAETTERQVAEKINGLHKYEELLAMNDPMVENWISTSGLSQEECAMIQPTYGPTPKQIFLTYGIPTTLISGLNLSLNVVNGIQIANGANMKAFPIMGIISGAGQIAFGSAIFPRAKDVWNGNTYGIERQQTLSMINIGLGSTTIFLSTWNLITNRTPKEKLSSWNIYRFPTQGNSGGLAFNFTRKF